MSNTEIFSPNILPEEKPYTRSQTERAKELVGSIVDAQEELDALPRGALVEIAWNAIAGHRLELNRLGDVPEVQRLEKERDVRLQLLTEAEQKQAFSQADAWVDFNL